MTTRHGIGPRARIAINVSSSLVVGGSPRPMCSASDQRRYSRMRSSEAPSLTSDAIFPTYASYSSVGQPPMGSHIVLSTSRSRARHSRAAYLSIGIGADLEVGWLGQHAQTVVCVWHESVRQNQENFLSKPSFRTDSKGKWHLNRPLACSFGQIVRRPQLNPSRCQQRPLTHL